MPGATVKSDHWSTKHLTPNSHARSKDHALSRGAAEYHELRQAIFDHGSPFLRPGTRAVDLNAGDGSLIEPLVREFEDACQFILLDKDPENVMACTDRFKSLAGRGRVRPMELDIQTRFPEAAANLILCSLAATELDEGRRNEVLGDCHRFLVRGGCLLLIEHMDEEARLNGIGHGGDPEVVLELEHAGFDSVQRIFENGEIVAIMAMKD